MAPKPGTVFKLPPHDIITEGGAVGVLLSNRPARVWVDKADFDRIVKAHGNRSWSWVEADRYVNLRPDQKRSVPIARLVVGNSDRFIRYADGDRLNLRRENLSTEKPVKPGPRVKRQVPAMPKPAKSGRPKGSKAATSRPTAPRAETPPVPLSAFLRGRESCPEVPASHPPSKVTPPKPSRPVFAPRTQTPPALPIPTQAPSVPATALFVKRSPSVVSTVKRPGKSQP